MRHQVSFIILLTLFAPAYGQERLNQFSIDQDRLAGAPDFSYLNHPLGPEDRVFVKNGHFYTVGKDLKPDTTDDRRLRLFGVNMAFGANFPEKQDAQRIARRLRKLGVNLVRLHHMDSSPDRDPQTARSTLTTGPYPTLNPVSVPRLRNFVDMLKAEGIYVNLNLHVGYEFRPAVDKVPAIPGMDRLPTHSKPLHIFYPRMVDLQVEYTKKLIDALKLKGNPVLAMVEIDNETSLIDAWQKNQIEKLVQGEYKAELDRQRAGFAGKTDAEFMVDRDRAYLKRMLAGIRESTDKWVPVAGTQVGFGGFMNYDSHQDLDYQDNHFYIDHFAFPHQRWDSRDWRIRDATATSTGFANYLNMAATREAGRPYTVSEYNQPFPNTKAAELNPTLAVFAAFQDWDAIIHFAYEHGREWDRSGPSGFNLNGDWTKWPQIGQSAWLFRTGAVQTAKKALDIPLPYAVRLESAEKKFDGRATTFLKPAGFDANVALVHRVAMATKGAGPMPEEAKSVPAPYRADTGEFVFDPDSRVFRVEAPMAAGVFGFLGDKKGAAGAIEVQLGAGTRDFISLLLTSLDKKPLAKSKRMLLTAPGYTMWAGQKLVNYPGTTDWFTLPSSDGRPSGLYSGPGPVVMERVECTVKLTNGAKSLTVYPLDGSGARMKPLQAGKVSGGFKIQLTGETAWYELAAQ